MISNTLQLQKKINKKQQKSPKDRKGIVFLKNLPHGFFEEQLKKYFEQFGNVTRVRLARSKTTGNSKGYAFVEFEYPEVAAVAAETMDNYLMFKHIVKASYIPPEEQKFNYFRTSVKRIRNKSGKLVWVSGKTASIQQKVKTHNDWNEHNFQKRTEKQLKKLEKIGGKYAHLGIDINALVVQPKILDDKNEEKKIKTTIENNQKLLSREKMLATNVASSKNQNRHESNVSLRDLLGDTLQEDTEDEDYLAMADSEEDIGQSDKSSDNQTYGSTKDSDSEDIEDGETKTHDDSKPIMRGKSKKSKSGVKSSNVEHIDKIAKRKLRAGRISKTSKKAGKQSTGNKKAAILKMATAKELAEPLSKFRAKSSKPIETKKNLRKLK